MKKIIIILLIATNLITLSFLSKNKNEKETQDKEIKKVKVLEENITQLKNDNSSLYEYKDKISNIKETIDTLENYNATNETKVNYLTWVLANDSIYYRDNIRKTLEK